MGYGETITITDETQDIRQCWRTPPQLFDDLNAIFHFTVDACANQDNALLPRFWSVDDDARLHDWTDESVFCNPPFGEIATFVIKAPQAKTTVFLLPVTALTTKYFGQTPASVVALPPHRIKFVAPDEIKDKLKSTGGPSLGTVVLIYGLTTNNQLTQIKNMGFSVFSILD
jgi:phage N-6-adenine-methyltransferase